MGANSSVSNGGPAITEEQWGRMQEVWSKICTNEQFKPKCIIQFLCKHSKTMRCHRVM